MRNNDDDKYGKKIGPVRIVKCNSVAEIRSQLYETGTGRRVRDVRVFLRGATGDHRPTKMGMRIDDELLPFVRKILKKTKTPDGEAA